MDPAAEIFKQWPLFGSICLAIIWLVRLEAKVLFLDNGHKESKEKTDSLSNKMNSIAEAIARIEGMLLGSEKKKGDLQ